MQHIGPRCKFSFVSYRTNPQATFKEKLSSKSTVLSEQTVCTVTLCHCQLILLPAYSVY